MADYSAMHSRAVALIARHGAPVTFTFNVPGTETPSSGAFVGPSTTTIGGSAVQKKGDPNMYAALGLIEQDTRTLLVGISDATLRLSLSGATCVWDGVTFFVKKLWEVAPNAQPIIAVVVISV